MKLEDLDGWAYDPRSGIAYDNLGSFDHMQVVSGLVRVELEDAWRIGFIPLAVLANILRLRGWTVVPPETEKEETDG